MWIEWTIPLQKLEISKVHVGPLQESLKPLTPLSYRDGPIVFPNLNLLLPGLLVKEYDSTTGRLQLSLTEGPATAAKLKALQDYFLSSVFLNQKTWFSESNRSKEQIVTAFQPFLDESVLHLYCPLQTDEKKHGISIWKQGEWKRLSAPGLLQKGDSVRVALRLQGISYQTNPQTGSWTGRFRVQHRISCLFVCPSLRSGPIHLLENRDAHSHNTHEENKR